MEYRVSVLQFEPKFLDTKGNLERITALLRNVETDLIVLPELCTSGYLFGSRDEVEAASESLPSGAVFQAFSALAWDKQCSIVYGFAEQSGQDFYNSSALINPDGSHYLYRKSHLFDREKLFFTPGNTEFHVFPAKSGVRIGMMICFDWQFPEAARTLALKGAQIICHPANLVLPWCQQSMSLRSLENRVYSLTANRIGIEEHAGISLQFTGQSQILGTKGDILLRLSDSETGVHTCTIDPELALDKSITPRNDAFQDRRPDLYEL